MIQFSNNVEMTELIQNFVRVIEKRVICKTINEKACARSYMLYLKKSVICLYEHKN